MGTNLYTYTRRACLVHWLMVGSILTAYGRVKLRCFDQANYIGFAVLELVVIMF